MDRRSFLSNMLKVGGAAAVAGTVSLVPNTEKTEQASHVADFTNGRLKRNFNGQWFFEFESTATFDISGRKELIAEIGDSSFLLKDPKNIDTIDLGYCTLYRIEGKGWERLKGEEKAVPYWF